MTPSRYLAEVKQLFLENGDPERAQGQMRYMRHKFEYYGLKATEWVALAKELFAENGLFDGEELKSFVRLCYEDDYRETTCCGIEMLQKMLKKQPENFIDFLEELIITDSWRDTVDWLAKLAGIHFRRFPHLIKPVTKRWMVSGNIWLQRTSMIFQLMYKDQTDFDLMKSCILRLAGSKEFFIQKGAGWALRQYSKTNPEGVIAFIEANPQLAGLTKREGLKWLKKSGINRLT